LEMKLAQEDRAKLVTEESCAVGILSGAGGF